METAVQKICCICGLDVRRIRRTRDPRGNYYCKPCYERRLAEYRKRVQEIAAQSRAGGKVIIRAPKPTAADRSAGSVDVLPVDSGRLRRQLPRPQPLRKREAAIAEEAPAPSPDVSHLEPSPPDVRVPTRLYTAVGSGLERTARALCTATKWIFRDEPAPSIKNEATMEPPVDKAPPTQPVAVVSAPIDEVRVDEIVQARRSVRRRGSSRKEVRISDLLGEEAQEAVESARLHPERVSEPEIPVSPITNPPVTSMVNDFSGLALPQPQLVSGLIESARRLRDEAMNSTPFRMAE